MKNTLHLAVGMALLLSSCYCTRYYNQTSSARYLRGNKAFTICYEPPGMVHGKTVPVTIYTADNAFAHRALDTKNKNIVGDITYENKGLVGVCAEVFYKLRPFPGPLLGIGLDYSRNAFTGKYFTHDAKMKVNEKQTVNQQRINLSFNYVTLIRNKLMGYIALQPGYVFTKYNTLVNDHLNYRSNKSTVSARLGYGFQYYVRPLVALNLEAGYGAGAYVRAGICCWMF